METSATFRRRVPPLPVPSVAAVRKALFLYTVYAVPAALLLSRDTGPLADAGVAVTLAAGIVSALHAARRSRRPAIALHAMLIPVQFVLSVPSNVPLAGLAISVAVLAAARPRFPHLRPPARRLFRTLHVGLSVSWLGLATAMTALAVTGLVTSDAHLRHDVYRIMHVFDLALVIPVVVLAILSGLVMSLGTPWGLIRHWWVLIKFGSAVAIPLVAGVQHLWISGLISRTAAGATSGGTGVRLLVCFLAYDVTLWTATALSVYKPGGRTPWSRPAAAVTRRSAPPCR